MRSYALILRSGQEVAQVQWLFLTLLRTNRISVNLSLSVVTGYMEISMSFLERVHKLHGNFHECIVVQVHGNFHVPCL